MRNQKGQIVRIGDRWYVRYWERRNIGGSIERKRVTHQLGPVTKRGKHPPADIETDAERYMATVNSGTIPAERIVTIGDFVERVYIPNIEKFQRPSTLKGYRQVWSQHLKPLCDEAWLKRVRTHQAQGWLDTIARDGSLSRNSLKRIQSVLSGIFSLAKQLGYYDGVNPLQDTRVDPKAAEPAETHAYGLEEVQSFLAVLSGLANVAVAMAAFTGLRVGEIEGLQWQDYRNVASAAMKAAGISGEIHVNRSIWNGRIGEPKTRQSAAPVPVIPVLAATLETYRLRSGNPQTGPIFANTLGKPMSMNNLLGRIIRPTVNRCGLCGKPEGRKHLKADHQFERDSQLPQWHGWHAFRRGLGSNLYRLDVSPLAIQRILRHSNVNTTTSYYIKSSADDVLRAMAKLGDTFGTLESIPAQLAESIN